jgi:hypothetical protein
MWALSDLPDWRTQMITSLKLFDLIACQLGIPQTPEGREHLLWHTAITITELIEEMGDGDDVNPAYIDTKLYGEVYHHSFTLNGVLFDCHLLANCNRTDYSGIVWDGWSLAQYMLRGYPALVCNGVIVKRHWED